MLICCFTFRHELVPHSVPNSSPVPLSNVLWGSGVCSVLVRSVSPCRLVLEVHLFPSPPCAVLALARRLCPLFYSSCLSGSTRFRPGVCVCNIWIDVKPLLFSFFFPSCRGPEASQQDSGQRRRLLRSVKSFWDARMTYVPSVFRFSLSFFMFIVYHFEEIFFRSVFLIQLHVRGFSSQRITSMIHFLSSVCVCLCVCLSVYVVCQCLSLYVCLSAYACMCVCTIYI